MTFRRALVTGCCGFIGAHVTRLLVNEGWYVEGVDDLSNGDLTSLNDMKFRAIHDVLLPHYKTEPAAGGLLVMTSDFASSAVLGRVASGNYDVIFHLAANPRVEYSVQHPAVTTHDNIQKTVELMTAARGKIDRFVFASSSSCYGNAGQLPTTEECPPSPESPYGLQKLVIEQFASLYNKLYNMEFAALRFFNVYGPGQDGSSPYSTAISAWCTRLSNGDPLRSDGDGTQTRDMVYVEDVARAMLAAADFDGDLGYQMFNVGNEEAFQNKEILKYLTDKFPGAEINHAPARAGDVKETLASITKIKNVLGWSPQVKFWDGLEATLRWWNLS